MLARSAFLTRNPHPMLKSILVASDLSTRSRTAVRRAVGLARDRGAALCVLHVVEDDLLGDRMYAEVGRIEDALTAQVQALGRPRNCEVAVVGGHAFQAIGDEARARKADLIVMGAHRRQALRDMFVGTTIERVTRSAGRAVLMANAEPAGRWRKVFIATDLSETSGHAARKAHDLGLLTGAEVTFVHGYAPPARQEEAPHDGSGPDSLHRALEMFLQRLGLGGLNHGTRLIEGVGADAIAGLVEQAGPDLLVIGTRGLSGIQRLVLGSVAQQLMDRVEIDVLAVPPQA